MKDWEIFEQQCVEYLNKQFGTKELNFELLGGADSTQSDIIVVKNKKKSFYIEVKMKTAQCAQFVLFPDSETSTFSFSSNNKVSCTDNCTKIIEMMNKNFLFFSSTNSIKSLANNPDSNFLYYSWIIDCYKNKNAQYIITRNENGFLIFPIEKISNYFDVSGVYRVKKSGSTDPAIARRNAIEKAILEEFPDAIITYDRKKCYVTNSGSNFHNIEVDGYTYLFQSEDLKYKVRRLSNTFNSNVIFTIRLKTDAKQNKDDLQIFITSLAV